MPTLTKSYEFSASYQSGDRVIAHNYRILAEFGGVTETMEAALDRKIQDSLIHKIHSRDLGRDVDFLRGVVLSETALLNAFWRAISAVAPPAALTSLSLERDSRTRWTMAGEP